MQTAPDDRDTCHLCGSAPQCHPEYNTKRPWFEYLANTLTDNGGQHCPYAYSEVREVKL
ncbi:DUF7828 domain-containing protein [Citrobacter amalonaticus]